MTTTLDGRTALVTGAGRGIGRAIAIGLGRRGARVGLLARTQRDLDAVAAKIRDDGGTAIAPAADIGHAGQTRSALNRLAGELGPVELLVNNAAVVWPLGPTHNVDPGAVAAAMTINVVAPMTITRRVLPGMLSAGWGRIVNVSASTRCPSRAWIRKAMLPPAWSRTTFSRPIVQSPASAQWLTCSCFGSS